MLLDRSEAFGAVAASFFFYAILSMLLIFI